MRKHGRIDANHREVVEALESLGASVQSLADIGNGCPDLLVGFRGRDRKFEVKNGSKSPSRHRLTPAQFRWQRDWKGSSTVIVYSPEEAAEFLEQFLEGESRAL